MMNAYCHADAAGLRRLPPHAADHRPADHGRFHHHELDRFYASGAPKFAAATFLGMARSE